MKFRKRPVEIEAMQFTGGRENAARIIQWAEGIRHWSHQDELRVSNGEIARSYDPEHLTVHTLEGRMRADLGDWIIKGVAGEFYPCKPDIFAATYEQVE